MSGIYLFLRVDEEFSAVLQFIQGISIGCAGFHRDERAVVALHDLTFPWLVLQETVRHDGLTGTHVHHIRTHAHDAATRDDELQVYAVVDHLHLRHLAFVGADELDDLTAALLRRIHRQAFYRLAFHAVDLFDDHLRLTYLQLVSLATHGLDQHTQMQHAAAEHTPTALLSAFLYAQRQVLLQLFVQTILDVTAGHKLTVLTEERTVVDAESHTHRRLVDSNRFERFRVLGIANRVADLKSVNTDERTDIAVLHKVGLHVSHAGECMQLFDLGLHH